MQMLKKMMSWALALVLVLGAVCGGISVAHAVEGDLDVKVEKNDSSVTVSIVAKGNLTMGGLGGWLDFDRDAFTRVGQSSPKLDCMVVNNNPQSDHPEMLMFSADAKVNDDSQAVQNFSDGEALIVFTFNTTDQYDATKDYSFTLIIDELFDNNFNFYDVASNEITGTLEGETVTAVHTVKFVSNGTTLDTVEVNDGETVAQPADPTRDGYTFKGWKLNGADYNFSTPVTEDIILVADWEVNPGQIDKDVDLSNVKITKNVTLNPTDVTYEEITFTFNVEGYKVEGNNGQVTKDTMPVLGPVEITMSGNETTKDYTFGNKVEFPLGGVYYYEITEVTPDPVPEGWTFNTENAEYYLVLEVEEKDGTLILDSFFIRKDSEDGEKSDAVFNNTYAPTTDLTISKTVKADDPNPAEQGKKFQFHITFDKSFTGIINGEEVEFVAGVAHDFELADGDSLKIEGIPAGTTYTLVEDGAEYYTATATVTEGETAKAPVTGSYGEGVIVTGTAVAADADQNKVEVENEYSITPPTGVVIHSEMIIILALVLMAMAGSFILSRKLRRA